jgi:RNA polymerase sigma factor (sigma-70 family)
VTHPLRALHGAPSHDHTDATLVEKLAQGEAWALDEALHLYWSSVSLFATRALGDPESGKDVAQDAFIRLWQNRSAIGVGLLRAFLFRTARNLVIDELRKRAVRAREAPAIALHVDVPASPDDVFETRETGRIVGDAIALLPNKRREVFTLAYLHGLSYKEVAHALGISPATVKNQVAAALADLRAALDAQLR